MVKRGFSLIELILSIVVVAIISTSIPLVLKTTSELNQKAVTQESLMNAKTYMGLILKAPFSNRIIKISNVSASAETAYFFPIILKPGDKRNEFYKINKITGDGHRVFAYENSPELEPLFRVLPAQSPFGTRNLTVKSFVAASLSNSLYMSQFFVCILAISVTARSFFT